MFNCNYDPKCAAFQIIRQQEGEAAHLRAFNEAYRPDLAVETTSQGPQLVIPGAERSARQMAAARDAAGHGRIRPRVAQRDVSSIGGGLFAPIAPHEPELF